MSGLVVEVERSSLRQALRLERGSLGEDLCVTPRVTTTEVRTLRPRYARCYAREHPEPTPTRPTPANERNENLSVNPGFIN